MEHILTGHKRCAICQKFFWPIKSDQKYCTKCSGTRKYYKPKPTTKKKCPVCKRIFKTRRIVQKFCSPLCRYTYHQVIGTRHKKKCPECNRHFNTGRSFQIYCNHRCYLMAKARRDHANYIGRKGNGTNNS